MAVGTYLKAALSISIFLAAVGPAAASPPTQAQPEFPADGSVITGDTITYNGEDYIWTKLTFIPGATAVEHTGYFSEDYSEVESRAEDANLGSPPYAHVPGWEYTFFAGNPQVDPADETLVRGTKYYWTVDVTDGLGNTFAGDIWEFTIQNYKNCCPDPPDGAIYVDPNVLLCWQSGFGVEYHDIYFGTSFDDVNDGKYVPMGLPPPWTQPADKICWDPVADGGFTIEFGTTYYWRVDVIVGRQPPFFIPTEYYKGDVWSFTTEPEGLGTIRMDLWWDIVRPWPPWPIIPPPYPESDPDETRFLTSFNSGENLGDNYGGMIHGWLHPAKSGDYTFWLSSDDNGELFLSTDDQPANMVRIAWVDGWTGGPYDWYNEGGTLNPNQQSVPISLVSGQKYYIRARWIEDGGGDYCVVAWQGPDQPLAPVGGEPDAVIGGNRLSPFAQERAYDPEPCDGQTDVELPVTLRWSIGEYAAEHDVYIGIDKGLVESRYSGIYMGRAEFNSYGPIELKADQIYYWAIDEVNELGPAPYVWPGDVWSFSTVSGEAQCYYPEDGAVIPGEIITYLGNDYIFTELIFIPGPTAVKHTGYFSDDYDDVANRAEDAKIPPPILPYVPPENGYIVPPLGESLIRGRTYYWTVDAEDALGNVFGSDIWEFTIQGYFAYDPSPPNEATLISRDVLLSWLPGFGVEDHEIYMGTSREDVNDAVYDVFNQPPEFVASIEEPNFMVTGLPFETKFYWRVDQSQGRVPPFFISTALYKGEIWCFTTAPHRIFVDVDANGANDGTSWENAYNFLQDALADANSSPKPVEIRVAEGIYTPDSNSTDPNGSGDRMATFKLFDGVTLRGGYAGYGQPNPDVRDIKLYETILSGDLDSNDVEVNDPCDLLDEPTRAENSYHVVTGDRQGWPDTKVVVDGFTITAGNANGDFPGGERTGGGMNFCSGKIINCTITGNSAMWGGGMCYSMGEIANCNIKRNFVSGRGGGISYSSVQMTNCIISENSAVQGGGGINNTAGDMIMTNCIFIRNSAREGSAIWYIDGKFGVQTLVNCTFSGNLAEVGSGIIYLDYSSPTLINCILWDNSYPEIYGGSAVVIYSDIQGGWPGDGNIDADPCFVDGGGGNLRLSSGSPCIDAGYNNAPNLPPTDLDGHPRIIDGDCNGTAVVDMGAYEFNYAYIGDFDYSCTVDFLDLSIFGLAWMSQPGDFNWDFACNISIPADNMIDKRDLAAFADNWLGGF